MRVFHGSAIEVKEPEIRIGKFTKDFREGFYCTKLKRQAQRWAMRKETPTISIYEYTPDKTLSICDFKTMTDEWLDFIVDSRAGKQPWKGFDIIEGGVANDRVIDAVEAYINGYADVEHTLRQLIYHKPNYQICILNQEIVDNQLIFQSYERV